MTHCRNIEEQLSLYVDGLLDHAAADQVRAHVEHCAACAGLLADLTGIASTAKLLGPVAPPAHLYPRMAMRLPLASPGPGTGPTRGRAFWSWAAIAATVVAATGLAWFAIGIGRPDAPGVPPEPTVAGVPETIAAELELAVGHYERALSDLETAATAGEGALDADIAAVVRSGINTLDRAIAESRGALDADPSSEPARLSLFEALRRKVDLLQTTALIVNDTNPTEAARPVNTMERES